MPVQNKPIIHGRDHASDGADPIFPIPGGDTLDELILAAEPSGFWKLNESTGDTAFDSSGNGLDLVADGAFVDPDWGQPAGPPGEQTASFEIGPGNTGSRVAREFPSIEGDFTAGIWLSRNTTDATYVMGQGNPGRSGGDGWMFEIQNPGTGAGNRVIFVMKGTGFVEAINPLLTDTWVFLAGIHDATAGVCKLYVNGLLQGTSASFTFDPAGVSPLWIGHDGLPGGETFIVPAHFTGSYAFYVPSVLTGTQLLDMYDTATGAPAVDSAGYVLTANEDGTSDWAHSTVTIDGTPYETVTLGDNLTGTPSGANITIDAAAGGATPADPLVWMPLTTVTGGVPELVWDANDELIPTLTAL